MDEAALAGIAAALARIPQGLFVLTAQHEDRRTGILVSWVQQASFTPPMVSVAVAKGRPILPLISESRWFTLCQVPKDDKTMLRRFAGGSDLSQDGFLGVDLVPATMHHLPVPAASLAYMVCEVVCHMDIEGDHDVFVGAVRQAAYLRGEPLIHLRENGFKY